MTTHKKTVDVFGDEISIEWNGSVWTANSGIYQTAHASDAMRFELNRYFEASGEDIESDEIKEQIDDFIEQMK